MRLDIESLFLKNSNYRILELLFRDAPLPKVLEELIKIIESEREGMFASVLLVDEAGEKLTYGAGPSLPDFYNEAVDGIDIGPEVGSCGAAAFLKERVIADNLATHPNWQNYRDLAKDANLAACWSQPIVAADGKVLGTFGMYYSIPMVPTEMDLTFIEHSARLAAMAIERDSHQAHRRLVDKMIKEMPQAMLIVSDDNRIIECNAAFSNISGYSKEEIQELDIFRDVLMSNHEYLMDDIIETLKQQRTWRGEAKVKNRYGILLDVDATVSILRGDESKSNQTLIFFDDITSRKASERIIYEQANYDQLTRLPNRKKFYELLQEELIRAQHFTGLSLNSQNSPFSVIMMDLDFFKEVNDTLGHYLGDKILVEVANRLKEITHEKDILARLGGDEFALIIHTPNGIRDVEKCCNAMIQAFNKPYSANGIDDIYLSCSIGVSQYQDQVAIDILLKQADQALFHVKKDGRHSFKIFSDDMREKAEYFALLHRELKIAIDREEIEVYFQPIFSIDTGELKKFEALARWNHEVLGSIPPDKFIHIAEKNGLMPALGTLIRNKALKQFQGWYEEGYQVGVSINVSQREFSSSELADQIVDQLEQSHLPAELVTVEITESLFNREDVVLPQLHLLKDKGLSISIDDFGTGYSSLSYIANFPITELKIDRSFITHCVENTKQQSLIEAMITIGKQLELKIVAEGIEDDEQLQHLKNKHCTLGQGYLYSRPLPASEVIGFLKKKVTTH